MHETSFAPLLINRKRHPMFYYSIEPQNNHIIGGFSSSSITHKLTIYTVVHCPFEGTVTCMF